jgi:hypothetical protein
MSGSVIHKQSARSESIQAIDGKTAVSAGGNRVPGVHTDHRRQSGGTLSFGRFGRTVAVALAVALTLMAGVSCGKEEKPASFHPPVTPAAAMNEIPSFQLHPVKAAPPASPYDDVARFISALPCSSSSLRYLEDTDIWKVYAARTDSCWTDVNSKRFQAMRIWSETDLNGSFKDSNVLFYPFGGPDIITAFQLFADADTYILIGLEPVGNLPEVGKWKAPVMKRYFADMDSSLAYFYLKSYFITKEMLEDLQNDRIDGVLPILCFFLERSGASILDIRRIGFDDAGKSIEIPYERQIQRSKRPYGIVIDTYSAASEKRRKVYYFSSDLADAAFNPGSKFYPFLDSLPTMNVFVKSASYLLHYKEFSNIRNLILAKSRSILEDDTGIPYRFFKPDSWNVRLFGTYAKPVKDFRGVDQPDLEAAFKKNTAEPLPFDLGYHWKTNLDLLMLAQRK